MSGQFGRVNEFYVAYSPSSVCVEMHWLVRNLENGVRSVAKPAVFTEISREFQRIEPFASLEPEDAQKLADALWEAGYKARGAAGSAGQLAATERHLADMKAVGFAALVKLGVKP